MTLLEEDDPDAITQVKRVRSLRTRPREWEDQQIGLLEADLAAVEPLSEGVLQATIVFEKIRRVAKHSLKQMGEELERVRYMEDVRCADEGGAMRRSLAIERVEETTEKVEAILQGLEELAAKIRNREALLEGIRG